MIKIRNVNFEESINRLVIDIEGIDTRSFVFNLSNYTDFIKLKNS